MFHSIPLSGLFTCNVLTCFLEPIFYLKNITMDTWTLLKKFRGDSKAKWQKNNWHTTSNFFVSLLRDIRISFHRSIMYKANNFNATEDFFFDIYEIDPILVILSTLLLLPFLFGMIWFDWRGSDNKRSLLNMLVSSCSWAGIGLLLFVQVNSK